MTEFPFGRTVVSGIEAPLEATEEEICKIAQTKMKRAGLSTAPLHFRLYKKSVDARRRDDVHFVCSVLCWSDGPCAFAAAAKKLDTIHARFYPPENDEPVPGTLPLSAPPLVVGMGPAGLFSALYLAERGFSPVIIDRGASVEERARDVDTFWREQRLDTESNVQFGAGGAGTFSDGKLLTRIHDSRCDYVLSSLVRFGAPEDILTLAKPHVGTDVLRGVVAGILHRIEELGGRVMYHCRLDGLQNDAEGVTAVTSCGTIRAGIVILAVGNAARDTFVSLIRGGYAVDAKPISVGVRIEHLQKDIDAALYGKFAGHPALAHAEYALSDTRGDRGVYTFCMCPGGTVVAAASEDGGVVVNGMSYRARDGKNANAAVVVSVPVSDFENVDGSAALGAVAYQRRIERAAFAAGGNGYYAPAQTCGSFMTGSKPVLSDRVSSTYMRNGLVVPADLRALFPAPVGQGLVYALSSFGRQVQGFDAPHALLTAPETRTSSPVRIRRGDDYTAVGHPRIYPCGEGAGYAGGITSSAVDGLRAAQAVFSRYLPAKKTDF